MNWDDLVPHDVAVRQARWDRRACMLRMREVGLSLAEIARRYRVSPTTVGYLVHRALRDRRVKSPVDVWAADNSDAKRLFQYLVAPLKPPRVPRVLSAAAQQKAADALRRAGWVVASPD